MLNSIIESQPATPTTGYAILTSCITHERFARFTIMDLALNQIIFKKDYLDLYASDNVIGFFAIVKALQIRKKNNLDVNIYCANEFSVRWAKEKFCNSKLTDNCLKGHIAVANNVIRKFDIDSLNPWHNQWPKIKDLVSVARFNFSGPNFGDIEEDNNEFNFELLPE